MLEEVWKPVVGPCPKGMQCRHLNDRKDDNTLDNLRWGTPKEDRLDMLLNSNPLAKLTDDDVRFIRKSTDKHVNLAKRFGVCPQTIINARVWQTYRHVEA